MTLGTGGILRGLIHHKFTILIYVVTCGAVFNACVFVVGIMGKTDKRPFVVFKNAGINVHAVIAQGSNGDQH